MELMIKMATKKDDTLVPVEKYLSAGIHIGTKFRTKDMAEYIYKINPNGLAILNVQRIDEKLREAAQYLAKFEPKDMLIVGRRENSWTPVKKFAETIGARYYVGRYPAGVITNPNLDTFIEPKVLLVADPWLDKNAIKDAVSIKIPVIGLCDSNNVTKNVDVIIPCNNKGSKSLSIVFWILTNEFLKAKGIKAKELKLEDFEG